ncbi:predicted protein [Plenodomus lingam JN3]|uniref:Predicted protein n=1 Tax=Leptosphaeria maculans (strain JN3 / isolate v23.1.3 / race Av1-4-5-6-7-8) TaxID=985895 RepID=E5AB23_LEPMJ|nr:predicted protein [Plenodomus lingam JN3]CBY00864.1 predicted protein [Plenodomus lingam JN3]
MQQPVFSCRLPTSALMAAYERSLCTMEGFFLAAWLHINEPLHSSVPPWIRHNNVG